MARLSRRDGKFKPLLYAEAAIPHGLVAGGDEFDHELDGADREVAADGCGDTYEATVPVAVHVAPSSTTRPPTAARPGRRPAARSTFLDEVPGIRAFREVCPLFYRAVRPLHRQECRESE
ncbi:hypothetical protein [Streptomyces sp. NPDC090080]|uniref:hypothetical protein n=1 Tax=Streptomyces sp. NPDC090080 TaxID=3365939 RepID=UPI00381E3001